MNQSTTTPDERFALVAEVLVGKPGVAIGSRSTGVKKGFGSSALTVNDKIFAMLFKDRLVVKLPRQRVDALIELGAGERFDPGRGRQMKEWLAIDPRSDEEWLRLATEGMEFVGSKR
ncbi:MAG: TfoX/Sxy family protein [Chloroflexota bacterium]|nr:TfoX/Sxy family protein [Chloroflexota bacterium]